MTKKTLLLTAILLMGAASVSVAQGKAADAPPPLVMELEVDGKSVPVEPNRTFEVEINGRKVPVRLKVLPHRVFDREGVRFQYPADHGWEVDRGESAVTIYTLDGNNTVIMLMKYNVPIEEGKARQRMADGLLAQYGKNAKQSPLTLKLGEITATGTRVDAKIVGESMRQDIYSFKHRDSTWLLMIQDTPNDGEPSAETRAVVEMLQKTFELKPK